MKVVDTQDGVVRLCNLENFSLEKTLESGQCFRFNKEGNAYTIQAQDKITKAMQISDSEVWFIANVNEVETFWIPYLNISGDYSPVLEIVRGKPFLEKATEFSKGLKIINQDPWETLICFIISQRNNIPKIKSTVSKLCNACGKKIEFADNTFYTFPSPDELLVGLEKYGDSLSLGYRLDYVRGAARAVKSGEINLEKLTARSGCEYSSAMLELMKLYGVGAKVANCVALFGLGHTKAFPVDVWIERIICNEFDGYLNIEEFKEYAGIIQQYMFYYGRSIGK